MEITFLGTGAAQGVPPAFSRSSFFENIRETKSKELRSKSALRLGKHSQIDFGPDSNWQNIRFNLDMYDVRNIFITHTHSDHLSCFDLFDVYKMAYEKPEYCNSEPIKLYLSKPAYEWVYKNFLPIVKIKPLNDRIIPQTLDYFRAYKDKNILFETIKGYHTGYGEDECSLNYLFKNSEADKTLLYAVDTGYYSDEAFEFLQGRKVDYVIMECTFGLDKIRGNVGDKHLNLKTFNQQVDRLANLGFLTEKTPVYLTHISPATELSYDEYQDILNQYEFNYILAYDGLVFEY